MSTEMLEYGGISLKYLCSFFWCFNSHVPLGESVEDSPVEMMYINLNRTLLMQGSKNSGFYIHFLLHFKQRKILLVKT